ncbi:uncharacterized protein LOC142888922 [Nelusetta ayraudi]|uniref:uncharacterized protein LOC142888922 n=1 Tax=Nelusetta ayraudi TaxID=303726 RepID=UPI003F6EEA8B
MFLFNTQKTRNLKCKQAKKTMEIMKELMQSNENANKVKGHLHELNRLCDEANACQNSLEGLLPDNEYAKQVQWLKYKIAELSAFGQDVQLWLCEVKQSSIGDGQQMTSFTMVDNDKQPGDVNWDDIGPDDSVSNAPKSKATSWSGSSGTSSHIRIRAERAAIMERVAALDKKHELEAQQELLKRRQEQLELETELAAANAKISVLESMQARDSSKKSLQSDGMSSYDRKGAAQNPHEEVSTEKVQHPQVVRPKTRETSVKGYDLPHTVKQSMQTHVSAQQHDHKSTTMQRFNSAPRQEHTSVDKLAEIMEKQNKITEALVKQHNMSSLPSLSIPVFKGEPLDYLFFIRAFEYGIEKRTDNSRDRLHFLEQFTAGQPQELYSAA